MSAHCQTIRCPVIVAHDNCGKDNPRGVGAMRNSILYTGLVPLYDYIIFLDADDVLPPNYVEELLRVVDGDKCIAICPAAMFGEQTGGIWPATPVTVAGLLDGNNIHSSQLIPVDVLQRAGGYDEELLAWEDWDLWLRLVKAGYEFRYTNKTNLAYRRHADSRDHMHKASLEQTRELFRSRYL
jgi:GT2 family glycosyltransferase